MIVLSPTSSNKVIVTLKEFSFLTQSYYTFELVNQNSYDGFIFSPDNNSLSPYYDSFTVSIGTAVSLTGSVVLNLESGEYHYSVHEMATQYDLDLNNSVGVVEVGLLMVASTYSLNDIKSFTESNYDTIRVFNEL
jgi:hypothetical protein